MLPPAFCVECLPGAIRVESSNSPFTDLRCFPARPERPNHDFVERSFIMMNGGPNVLKNAVHAMTDCTVRPLGYETPDPEGGNPDLRRTLDDAWLVSHQANGRIIDGLAKRLDYVLGCRMRQQKEVTQDVLAQQGPLEFVAENLHVKDVFVGGRRYVVCRNKLEARKDVAARAAIVEKLEETLSHGPKAMISNKGFSRFLRVEKGSVTIDRDAVERDARFDGTFVLTTNTALSAAELATTYKSLWRVERVFRTEKSVLEMRPLYHHTDRNSIGHIVACFRALRLEVDLQRRLDEKDVDVSWPDLMRDLGRVQSVLVDLDGQRYRLRTDLAGHAHHAFAAAGVRPPSVITALSPPSPPQPPEERTRAAV